MNKRIEGLQEQIADLKRRWPAHSAPPALLQQLDELEAALESELNKTDEKKHGAEADDPV